MKDANYPLFPIFAFLGFILGLVPLPWHLQAWNAGTCSYMIWASISCLIMFINSVAWSGTVANFAPVWCDISTKFFIGAGVGIPASSLCIVRRLYNIATLRHATVTREDKIRGVFIDLSITVGIPFLVMILHICVQGHRFNILENFGCFPEIVNTALAYPTVFMWPVLLGLISFVYAALSLFAFWKRRAQFNDMLSKGASMTVGRYMRLMALSCCEMMCTIPLGAYGMYMNTYGVGLVPYVSWADLHYDFSRVVLVPAIEWKSDHSYEVSVELNRWIYPTCALLFFALFGFAEEAKRNYRSTFRFIARHSTSKSSATEVFGTTLTSLRLPTCSFAKLGLSKITSRISRSSGSTMIDVDIEKSVVLLSPSKSETSSHLWSPIIHITNMSTSPASVYCPDSPKSSSSGTAVSSDHISIPEPSRPLSLDTITNPPAVYQYHRPLALAAAYPICRPRGTESAEPSS